MTGQNRPRAGDLREVARMPGEYSGSAAAALSPFTAPP